MALTKIFSSRLMTISQSVQLTFHRSISLSSTQLSYKNVNDKPVDPTWKNVVDANATSLLALEVIRASGIILGKVFSEPATINYPFEKGPLSPRFRGKLQFAFVYLVDVMQYAMGYRPTVVNTTSIALILPCRAYW